MPGSTKVWDAWNTMKIVRGGSNYSFYLNGYLIYSFSDSSFDPRVCVLPFYSGNVQTELHYDYAKLDIGAAAGLVPGEKVIAVPVADQRSSRSQLAKRVLKQEDVNRYPRRRHRQRMPPAGIFISMHFLFLPPLIEII